MTKLELFLILFPVDGNEQRASNPDGPWRVHLLAWLLVLHGLLGWNPK
jgi:hypothetical protein